jgi:hypothetical protein
MAVLLTRQGRVDASRSMYRDIVNTNDYYHVAIGKTLEWVDEALPDNPVDSTHMINKFRRDMIFTTLVSSADVCHLTRRIDWVENTVYDDYDDSYGRVYSDVFGTAGETPTYQAYSGATTLADANFYVLTNEFKVYKCLDNNNGAPSTIKPEFTTGYPAVLEDGYLWKFMFQVSASDQNKFLDSNYLPVRKFTTDPQLPYGDVNGEIDLIVMNDVGSGYSSPGTTTVSIIGDGVGATASANITGGEITSITVDTPGSGYSFAFVQITTTTGGVGADAYASVGDVDSLPTLQANMESTAVRGTIDKISVILSGTNYVAADTTVVIEGDGSGAEASVTVDPDTGQILSILTTSQGAGYTYANISFSQLAGNGQDATARAIISPISGHSSHPINELFGNRIGIVVNLSDNTNTDVFLNNDFRQVALIKNIYPYVSPTAPYTAATGNACYMIDVADSAPYNIDDSISSSDGGEFTVIQKTDDGSGTFQVFLLPSIRLLSNTSILVNNTDPATGLVINSRIQPEIDYTTGEVVYFDNRSTINRQPDQVETIKAILTF